MLNSFTVQGNLVETPVLTTAKNNPESTYCSFTIACNRSDKKGGTDFFRCTAFGLLARFITTYFEKGQQILITGEVRINCVSDMGVSRYYTNILVRNAYFCGRKVDVHDIEFPNDTDHKTLIKNFNTVVADKFSDEQIDVDRTTVNPGRIAKLPGTMSVKGENTPERPHRQSCIITTNSDQPPLTEAQIQAYIDKYSQQEAAHKAPTASTGTKKPLPKKRRINDVEEYLDHYNIVYRVKETTLDGKPATYYELERCPFNDHKKNYRSALIQFPDKSVVFKCLRNRCHDYDISDFIAKYPLPKVIPLLEGDILLELALINNRIIAVSCKSIQLVNEDDIEQVLAAVRYHPLKFGTVVGGGRLRLIDVLCNDLPVLLIAVGGHSPDLCIY